MKGHSDYLELRSDRQRNWAAIIAVLAAYADWNDRTTRPTWPRIAEQAGVSRATVARCIAWLIARGLLGVVETGSTPLLRCGVLYGIYPDEPNRAAEYVLTVRTPPPERRRRPTCESGGQAETETPSRTRQGPERTPPRARSTDTSGEARWPLTRCPETRSDKLSAADELRRRSALLAEISSEHLRHLLTPYWANAWTPADCLHCLDHVPGGRLQPFTDRVRHVPGWIRYRLGQWHDRRGGIVLSPSQLRERERARIRAEQDARRRERERTSAAAAATDHARHAAAARQQLEAVHARVAQTVQMADRLLGVAASERAPADAAPAVVPGVASVTTAHGATEWARVARMLLGVSDPAARASIIAAARGDVGEDAMEAP